MSWTSVAGPTAWRGQLANLGKRDSRGPVVGVDLYFCNGADHLSAVEGADCNLHLQGHPHSHSQWKGRLDPLICRSATIVRFSVIESFEDTDGFQVNKEVQGGAGHYSERPAS